MQTNLARKIFAVGSAAAIALSAFAPMAAQAAAHAAGTNVKSSDGTVWMITTDGMRRAYTSAGAFLSYGFNSFSSVVDANADDLALTAGSFIPPQDGKIICSDRGSDKGTCYLVTGGQKAGFTSASVFTGLGFSFSRVGYGDMSWMTSASNIDNTSAGHRAGVLVNNNGTVQLVGATGLVGIPDLATFNSWGYSFADVVPSNAADGALVQTSVMVSRTAGQLSPTGTSGGVTPPPPSTGTSVNVTTGAMTPSTVLPTGANTVKVGDVNFTAPSNGAISIAGLTVKRIGVGSTTDISNAYIYDGTTRLSSGRTFNSSTNQASFTLNVQIPANTTKTLSLYISLSTSATTGSAHQFTIENAGSVNATGATVTGNFPISSNTHTVSGTSAGTITLTKTGSPSNPRVGDREVKVSEVTLAAATEDAWVNTLTFTQGGNIANSALMNFKLKQAGVTVATATAVGTNSRLALAFTTPFKIDRGNNRIFELYADVDGRPADTIIFYIEEAADLQATGGTFGVGMTSTVTAMDTTAKAHTLTLQGGQFTITFTGPSSRNISNTANDVSVWEGSIYTANSVEIRNWRVAITDTTAADPDLADVGTEAIQDVKIWNADTNVVLAGPKELTSGANNVSQTLVFTDTATLAAGSTTKIKITVDVRNNPSGNITLVAFLNAFQSNDVKNVSSNTFLTPATDISPNAAVTGQTQTVTAGSLTVTAAPSPSDNTIVKGVQNAEVTAYNFAVGSGDTVKVNTVVVSGSISGTDDNVYGAAGASDTSATLNDVVLSAKLMDGATQVGQSKSFSSGIATFDNLNWSLAASQTKKLSLVINTNSAATLTATTDYMRFAILDTSGVVAVDSQGNSVTDNLTSSVGANNANGAPTAINGNAADVVVAVTDSGSLVASIAPDPTNPTSSLITAGSSDKVLAAFKFEATNDSFYLKKFNLMPIVSGSSSVASNDRIAQLKVRYKKQDGSTVTQSVGLSATNNTVDITAAPMYVAQNGNTTLEVLGDIAGFTLMDGSEAENITFALDADNTAAVNQATGVGSNSDDNTWAGADLTGNRHNVYRSVLSVAKGSTTTSNTTRAASQNVASVAMTASSSNASVLMRGSKRATDSVTTGWVANGMAAAATTATAVSGSSAISLVEAAASAVNDSTSFDFGASAGLEGYNRLNFNIRTSVAKAAGDIGVSVSSTADGTDDATLNGLGTVTVNNSNITATAANTWMNIDIAGPFVSTDRYVTFNIKANVDNNETIFIDDLRFYNDSMNLDIAGSINTIATSAGTRFDAKNSGGTAKAYGAYSGSATSGTVILIPGDGTTDVGSVTTSSDIEVTTSAQTLDIITNTITLMSADVSGVIETLSVSWDTGTVSTAGDFRWYDNSDTSGGNNLAGFTVVGPTSSTQSFTHGY